MATLWPHAAYAKDQPYARSILTTHVLHRFFQAGTLIGMLSGAGYEGLRHLRSRPAASPSSVTTTASPILRPPFPPPSTTLASPSAAVAKSTSSLPRLSPPSTRAITATVLRYAGTGSLALLPVGLFAVAGRMWGRERIEWQDRAWRLLENRGQVSVDRWSVVGMSVSTGAMVAIGMRTAALREWRMALGTIGFGSLLGTIGSVISRTR